MRFSVIFCLLLFVGCSSQDSNAPTKECVDLCLDHLLDGDDLSNGPCLSNNISDDWVCDIAHSPRQEIDNQLENTCEAFREGIAHHFVEVDEECNVIVIY